jgi:hypothetical protein
VYVLDVNGEPAKQAGGIFFAGSHVRGERQQGASWMNSGITNGMEIANENDPKRTTYEST